MSSRQHLPFFMDVRIVVKVGVKNQKILLFTCKWWNHQLAEYQHGKRILSVVNHSKTREQSFGMNFSYALNGTHEDRLGTNVTTLKVVWHWGKNEVKLKEMKNTKVLKEDKNHLKDKSRLLMSKINIFLNHNLHSVWWIWSVNFTPERRNSVSNANVD